MLSLSYIYIHTHTCTHTHALTQRKKDEGGRRASNAVSCWDPLSSLSHLIHLSSNPSFNEAITYRRTMRLLNDPHRDPLKRSSRNYYFSSIDSPPTSSHLPLEWRRDAQSIRDSFNLSFVCARASPRRFAILSREINFSYIQICTPVETDVTSDKRNEGLIVWVPKRFRLFIGLMDLDNSFFIFKISLNTHSRERCIIEIEISNYQKKNKKNLKYKNLFTFIWK